MDRGLNPTVAFGEIGNKQCLTAIDCMLDLAYHMGRWNIFRVLVTGFSRQRTHIRSPGHGHCQNGLEIQTNLPSGMGLVLTRRNKEYFKLSERKATGDLYTNAGRCKMQSK